MSTINDFKIRLLDLWNDAYKLTNAKKFRKKKKTLIKKIHRKLCCCFVFDNEHQNHSLYFFVFLAAQINRVNKKNGL